MIIGGDVVNSLIQSGYDQELSAVANSPVTALQGQTVPAGGVFNGEAPPTILNRVANITTNQATSSPLAHGGGGIHGRIAGNVTNSIVSVSVDPDPSGINNPGLIEQVTNRHFPFGAPDNIVLPRGSLSVKVEGNDRQQRHSTRIHGQSQPTRPGVPGRRSHRPAHRGLLRQAGTALSTCR